jgi:gas vesicle protein
MTVGGVIASVIALRWAKRNNEAETRKLEEQAKQAQKETDSIEIENAKKVIQMYKESIEELTALYKQYKEESQEQFDELKRDFNEFKAVCDETKRTLGERITKYADRVKKLEEMQDSDCSKCQYSANCEKRIQLGIPFNARSVKVGKPSTTKKPSTCPKKKLKKTETKLL